jgi:predicted metal-dependent phosphoesterase TrpH
MNGIVRVILREGKLVSSLKADLHSHTTASDGVCSPSENVRRAKAAGLQALGITDHDSVAGLKEAINEGNQIGVEVVPGIEISTSHQGQDIHVLGYFIDDGNESFLERLEQLRNVRDKRNEMMVNKLQELGIDITIEEVYARKQGRKEGENIGRPHIAEVLMEKGIVSSVEEAFHEYLGKEGRAYLNPPRISPEEGIQLIRAAGGVPVLAHPGLYDDDEMVIRLIEDHGLKAIEVYHPDHNEEEEKRYRRIAERYQLIMTAGSDFHGERNGTTFHAPIGTKTVSYDVVSNLKQLADQQKSSLL